MFYTYTDIFGLRILWRQTISLAGSGTEMIGFGWKALRGVDPEIARRSVASHWPQLIRHVGFPEVHGAMMDHLL